MLKKVLNSYEETTYLRLREVCEEFGACVYAKVRLADILPIEGSGISQREYRFALQAHFDFVLTDINHYPLFVVEFDGNTHLANAQRVRDQIKDRLCQQFALPLLRVNSRYLLKTYGGMDLLSWFIKVWFVQKDFEEAQDLGHIEAHEVYDPFLIMSDKDNHPFPLVLSHTAQREIRALFKAGRCKHPTPSAVFGLDADRNYHALAWLRLDDTNTVCVESAMQCQQFQSWMRDALQEVVFCELYQAVQLVLQGERRPTKFQHLKSKAASFQAQYTYIGTVGSRHVNDEPIFTQW